MKIKTRWNTLDEGSQNAYLVDNSDDELLEILECTAEDLKIGRAALLASKTRSRTIKVSIPVDLSDWIDLGKRKKREYLRLYDDETLVERFDCEIKVFKKARNLLLKTAKDLSDRSRKERDLVRLEIYWATDSDSQAAKRLNIGRSAFKSWREGQGLKLKESTNSVGKLSKVENDRRLAAYKSTQTDREAATKLDLKMLTFAAWRRSQGLPSRVTPGHTIAIEFHQAVKAERDLANQGIKLRDTQISELKAKLEALQAAECELCGHVKGNE